MKKWKKRRPQHPSLSSRSVYLGIPTWNTVNNRFPFGVVVVVSSWPKSITGVSHTKGEKSLLVFFFFRNFRLPTVIYFCVRGKKNTKQYDTPNGTRGVQLGTYFLCVLMPRRRTQISFHVPACVDHYIMMIMNHFFFFCRSLFRRFKRDIGVKKEKKQRFLQQQTAFYYYR